MCEFIETFGSPFVFKKKKKKESGKLDQWFLDLGILWVSKKTAGLPYAVSGCSFCRVKLHVRKNEKSFYLLSLFT